MGSAHSTRTVSREAPHGDVFLPLLWAIVVNKLLSLLEEAGTKVVAYADDAVILLQGKFTQTLCNLIAIGRKWAFSPVIVYWLYTEIVRPILLYGNIVWWPSLERNCNLKILYKIQRSAELCISGALRTTATEALNTILDL